VLRVQRIAASNIVAVLAGRSLNAVLEATWQEHADLTAAERGAVQDLSYGGLRHLGRLRAVLAELVPKPVANRELEALLVTALYQLEHSAAAPYAIVDHAVECAGAIAGPRMKSFVNAVLRNFQRQRPSLLDRADATDAGRYSYPEWWVDRVRAQYPDQAAALLAAGNVHPPMTVRANVRRQSPEAYLERLRAAGLPARLLQHGALRLEHPLPVGQLPGFGDGDVSVQDAGAQRTAGLLGLKDGMRVLDACAAPGGKSAHILETADVELTALDQDAQRLRRVQANLDRLRLGAAVRCADAGEPASWWDGVPFDRVLLDAPCSASGVVRRHPDIKWLRKPGDIAGFARQQARLLDALWKVVARGGKLLYVTCSVFREENQEAIDRFASRHGDVRLLGGMPGDEGQLLPNDEHDGFYFALLRKD
jgi:16S rRNA (cytosine967-C5)-methyltransferase